MSDDRLRMPDGRQSPPGSQQLRREFTLANAFSLAFGFISPIVALYSILGLGLAAAGPAFWFSFPIVLAGQLLVALTFGMLASRFPYCGGIYQWSAFLVGPEYAWFAGWAYIWALPISMAAVALAGSHFLAQLLGLDPSSPVVSLVLSAGLLLFTTWGNTRGRFILNAVVALCIVAEVIASLGVGLYLLVFHRIHPFSIVLESWRAPSLSGLDHFFTSPIVAAVAISGWALLGFESAGSIAEEVKDPRRAIPRAMLFSLACVAGVVALSAMSLILAMPATVLADGGAAADPVALTLAQYLGTLGFKAVLMLFMVGFAACLLGTQASVSRVIWAFARDDALPFSVWLKRLSPRDGLPVNAIVLTSFVAAGVLLISLTNIYATLVAFTTAGFYLAFAFPLIGAVIARLTGRWSDGPFHLGALTGPVVYASAAWIVFESVNIAWPRLAGVPWYENWAVSVMAVLIGALGVVVRLLIPKGTRRAGAMLVQEPAGSEGSHPAPGSSGV